MDWNPLIEEQAQAWYDNDLMPHEIADKLRMTLGRHVSIAEVRAHINVHRERRVAADVVEAVRAMHVTDRSATRAALAQRFGLPGATIARIVAPLRPNGGPPTKVTADGIRVITMPEPTPVEIPGWVPDRYRRLYLGIGEREGEERAASVVRLLKRGVSVTEAFG